MTRRTLTDWLGLSFLLPLALLPMRWAAGEIVVGKFNDASDVSKWRFDFGSATGTATFDPTQDANSDPNSGSMQISLQFQSSAGSDNKGAFTSDLFPSPGFNGNSLVGMQMDIMVDLNSAKDMFGGNGYFAIALRNGSNYDWEPQTPQGFDGNLKVQNAWQHLTVLGLTGTVDAIRALTLQLYGGPSQNIDGTVNFWIDNVVLNQLPGDANEDGVVDFKDLVALAANYNTQSGATWTQGDFNGDGKVNFTDLVTLASEYGQTVASYIAAQQAGGGLAAQTAIPEPLTIGLLSLAPLLAIRRRK